MTKPKPISRDSVPAALEKAERYRLLNEPFFAESICLDVLAIAPDDHRALVIYVLALCDQLASGQSGLVKRAQAAVAKLPTEYERLYYAGIVSERCAMAHLARERHGARDAAYFDLQEAMKLYESADAKKPDATHDDAVLRYNTCLRLLAMHDLREPVHEPGDYPLE